MWNFRAFAVDSFSLTFVVVDNGVLGVFTIVVGFGLSFNKNAVLGVFTIVVGFGLSFNNGVLGILKVAVDYGFLGVLLGFGK